MAFPVLPVPAVYPSCSSFAGSIPRLNVGSGKIWINNKWLINDSTIQVSCVEPPSTSNRIDTVIAVLDYENRDFLIKVINGVPSNNPVHVPDDQLPPYSYRIADVLIRSNSDHIEGDDITYLVGLVESGGAPLITGILENGKIDYYVAGWDAKFDNWLLSEKTDFNAWLDTLQDNLVSEQAATKLFAEIGNIWGYLNALGSAEDRSY